MGFRLLLFTVTVEGKTRVLSGIFKRTPPYVIVYKNMFDRWNTFTLGNLLVRVAWIVVPFIGLIIIRFFWLEFFSCGRNTTIPRWF